MTELSKDELRALLLTYEHQDQVTLSSDVARQIFNMWRRTEAQNERIRARAATWNSELTLGEAVSTYADYQSLVDVLRYIVTGHILPPTVGMTEAWLWFVDPDDDNSAYNTLEREKPEFAKAIGRAMGLSYNVDIPAIDA